MHRRKIAAALTAVTATSLLIAPPAQAAGLADQRITWQKCTDEPGFERLECGSFTAPMDWNNPRNGKTITIAVSRTVPLNGNAKTTVFTNPGGPGGAGRTLPMVYLNRPKLSENAEIVGIDPRGTGASDNVTCGGYQHRLASDWRDRSKAGLDLIYGGMELQAKFCQTKSGKLGKYITTEQTVRDLDLLRQVLGRKKVSWLGYSAGSWMGAYYATYFPKTLDKIVLDSNTEFTESWQKVFDNLPPGAELRFRVDFLPWVAKYDNVFQLGKTAEEVRQKYETTRARLAEQPLTLPDGTVVTPVLLDALIFGGLYSKGSFEGTAQLLAYIAQPAALAKSAPKQYPDSLMGTQMSIMCNDTPFRGDRKSLEREGNRSVKQYSLVGGYQVTGPCAWWDRPNVNLKRPTGKGVDSSLMVQSVRDPATPLAGAQRAHAKFANSRMLTVRDEGDHGIYGFGNDCVSDVVESYLVDGVVPRKDLSCPGVPLPAPGESTGNPLTKARELAVQLGW
ncbi:alpha/beta hydrolase [Lentzea sp. BCCO 10_0798]|uniref:Alpha/beta hydrolase n=1 Tax=Lentzea kristufekii TaxID=3095430 RepID=A0ABU4TZ98_9PSEU|nr:alpha/beta hydrolase [Lentzea sp. BCCO 10_0798]MDX8053643.1 alpha/beta hydrolase [Lentzea sp. BCCO 10_0798]